MIFVSTFATDFEKYLLGKFDLRREDRFIELHKRTRNAERQRSRQRWDSPIATPVVYVQAAGREQSRTNHP